MTPTDAEVEAVAEAIWDAFRHTKPLDLVESIPWNVVVVRAGQDTQIAGVMIMARIEARAAILRLDQVRGK